MGCVTSNPSSRPIRPTAADGGTQMDEGTESEVGGFSADKPEVTQTSDTPSGRRGNTPDTAPGSMDAKKTTPMESPKGTAKRGTGAAMDPGMFVTQQKAHLTDRYTRERKLGSGACGEVLLCRDRQTGAERAVKVIKKSSVNTSSSAALLEEVAVVKQLDHPNIMKLFEFFEDRRNYYLVMEVYKGGELFDEIINRQCFSEADAASIVKQVLSGCTYLHKHHIVHRDLKPENLLLESKEPDALIKIVDFGLSAYFDPTKKLKDRLGTAYYIAPEVLRKKYDEKCDIWATGVILYILLCGYPPFGGQTDQEILRRVEKGKFSFDPPEWANVSEEVKDLIRQMLIYDPQKRISAEAALQHPWLGKALKDHKTKNVPDAPALSNALGNMKKFQASQKLAQAAFLFIGSKLTTIEETKELTHIFRSLDKNGDGQLDRKELIEGYVQLMKMKGQTDEGITTEQIEREVDAILDTVDFDKNGTIEYSEFVTVAMDTEVLMSQDRLRAAFDMFDSDRSGKLAADELRKMFDVTDAQWDSILKEVDENNDGEVDFDEFVRMMQNLVDKK